MLETLVAKQNRRPLGIDTPVSDEDGDGPASAEWLGRDDDAYELVEDRLTVEAVLPSLDEREREVLRLRFIEDLPQSQIAETDRLLADARLAPSAGDARASSTTKQSEPVFPAPPRVPRATGLVHNNAEETTR